jgi:hypothetical protein
MPTVVPLPPEAPSLPSPTAPPLEANDIRNFFWCGINWGLGRRIREVSPPVRRRAFYNSFVGRIRYII